MASYPELQTITDIVAAAQRILILQADNPDADSLGSALALEHILGDMGKEPLLYCGIDIPTYLQHLEGWDRVSREVPRQFDASIIVDTSTINLFEQLAKTGQKVWLANKPCIVLDHHLEVQNEVPFATVTINDHSKSSTGELIYEIGKQAKWPLSVAAQTNMMTAILGDTQGLSNQQTSANTYRVMADMVDAGVDRPALEEARRETNKMPVSIFRYKAELIKRAELLADGRVAIVVIPQAEINQYSPLYNPGPLIIPDILQTEGVKTVVVFKQYNNGRVTAAIRCASRSDSAIAAELAEHFDGGGHPYASGFRVENGRPFNEIKSECIRYASQLLDNLERQTNETLQHTQPSD